MPGNVLCDKACYKKVRMVVAVLQAKRETLPAVGAGLLEQFRLQLAFEKLVGQALIHKDFLVVATRHAGADQFAGIVFAPGLAARPKIRAEGFFAPGTVHRRRDRRESGYRAKDFRMTQGQGERAMPAHGMS